MGSRTYEDSFTGDKYMEMTCDYCGEKQTIILEPDPLDGAPKRVKTIKKHDGRGWTLFQGYGGNVLLCPECSEKEWQLMEEERK